MATLLEKIAEKKRLAAAMAANGGKEMVDVSTPHVVEKEKEEVCEPIQSSVPQPELTQPKIIQAEHALTFAEKMALKKAQSLKPTVVETLPVTLPLSSAPAITAEISKSSLPISTDANAQTEAEAKTAQAYADIKAKLNLLSDMAEADLPNAMKELKASLLQNPQACYLMMPQDIGQMVIALRAMRKEAVVEATAEPKAKKAKASKALTAEEIAAAFDSL